LLINTGTVFSFSHRMTQSPISLLFSVLNRALRFLRWDLPSTRAPTWEMAGTWWTL